jgi:hypothetical protein
MSFSGLDPPEKNRNAQVLKAVLEKAGLKVTYNNPIGTGRSRKSCPCLFYPVTATGSPPCVMKIVEFDSQKRQ